MERLEPIARPYHLISLTSKEFAKAVAAWRNAGKTTSEGTGTSAAPAAQSVAEKLARSMEAEHEKVVALLMEEQEAARRKIVEVWTRFNPLIADLILIFTI